MWLKMRLKTKFNTVIQKLFYNFLNNVNIKNKLIVSFISVVLIPVALVGAILTSGMREIVIKQAINEAVSSANKAERDLEEIFETFMHVSNRLYVDSNLENILAKKYQSAWDLLIAFRSYTAFDDFINYYKEIKDIRFYMLDDSLLENAQHIKTTKDIKNYTWYQNTIDKRGLISWEYTYNEDKQDFFLSLTRLISNSNGMPIGVLVMDVNRDYIYSLLKNDPYQTMVVNSQGFIIAAKDYDIMGETLESIGLGKLYDGESGEISNYVFNARKSVATVKTYIPPMSNNKFRIISVFPTKNIVQDANNVILRGAIIMASSLIISLVLIIFISKALSSRIRKLSKEMHSVATGDLNISVSINGEDEIGQLSKDLSAMVKSINELIHEVYEVNLQKNQMLMMQKEIRYKMLSSQVNPHFLFNALEAIRMKAHARGEDEIANKVKSLGKILRTSLEVTRDMIKLEKEFDLVKNYLELQNFRFGDKIKYEINNCNVNLDYKVLPFIIQPIVENAVVHGLEGKEGEGLVTVTIINENRIIKITVGDNGMGMDDERLLYLRNTIDEQDSPDESIGLRNVHQRIQLHYGREYGVRIDSERGMGTKVQILLPEEGEAAC